MARRWATWHAACAVMGMAPESRTSVPKSEPRLVRDRDEEGREIEDALPGPDEPQSPSVSSPTAEERAAEQKEHEDPVTRATIDSFPASDPPSWG